MMSLSFCLLNTAQLLFNVMGCLHDPANFQQTSSNSRVFWIHLLEVCWAFAGRLLDRV